MSGSGEPVIWIKRLGYAFPGNGYLFLTFFFFYMASLSLYGIFVTVNEIPRWDRVWLVLFFTVCPVNDARVTNICFPYGFCYGAFFIAFFLLTQFFSIKNIFLRWFVRVCTLILFVASFPINSFLVFYAIPLAYIWYRENRRGISLLWRYADFLVIPVAFWVIKKSLWMPPYGFYAGYNKVTLLSLVKSMALSLPAMVAVAGRILIEVASPVLPIGLCTWMIYKIFQSLIVGESFENEKRGIAGIGLVMGTVIMMVGLFPYLVVGRSIGMEILGFSGKDVMLVPLGAACMFYYGIQLCPLQKELKSALCLMFVVSSIVLMNQRYIEYQEIAYQQMSVKEHMSDSEEILQGQNFIFVYLGEPKWWIRQYVLSGLAREAFGNEKRLFLRPEDIHHAYWFKEGLGENMLTHSFYNLGDYNLHNQQIDGTILYQPVSRSKMWLAMPILKFDEMFRPQMFQERLRRLGYIDYVPAGGPVVNDSGERTMWSKEAMEDISRRRPMPYMRP